MVALDGRFYQVKADGRAYGIEPRARTPFAVVTFFEPTLYRTLETPTDFDGVRALLDRLVGDEAPCCAVRLDGRFEYVKTRSVPRQRKPYPPLAEVVKHQPTFELRDLPGSIVGFRFSSYAQGLNVAGYHFHFIADDRSAGGHVLGFRLAGGELSVDREADLRLELPDGVDLPVRDPSAAKREELDRIERVARTGSAGAAYVAQLSRSRNFTIVAFPDAAGPPDPAPPFRLARGGRLPPGPPRHPYTLRARRRPRRPVRSRATSSAAPGGLAKDRT